LVLYTKAECGLCEEMKQQMLGANCSELYELVEVDIEEDAQLFAQYRFEIPVLSINGVEAFRHHLRAEEFRAYVTSLSSGRSETPD
ncbi:MAG TPA: glutaredoxin family protein, partial [Pyrinomonadaceae bacterium]|nr:glutaredoxin family protein [Pyrinomonadaceae bacterium]